MTLGTPYTGRGQGVSGARKRILNGRQATMKSIESRVEKLEETIKQITKPKDVFPVVQCLEDLEQLDANGYSGPILMFPSPKRSDNYPESLNET